MKKTLIALAVTASFSGAAMAQSSVQLYGIIDLGVIHATGIPTAYKNGVYSTGSINKLGSGVQSGSRIGVKGTEDLGGGLSAFFVAESGFCANGGSTAQQGQGGSFCTGGPVSGFMSRQALVGLKGSFGTLSAGRTYPTTFTNEAMVDPFGAGTTGAAFTLDYDSAYNYLRVSQMVKYDTPILSGFQATLAYAFGAQAGNNSKGRLYNANLTYTNGPIMAGVGYLNQNYIIGLPNGGIPGVSAPGSTGYVAGPSANLVNLNGQSTNKIEQIFGSYDFGVAKISAMYQSLKADEPAGYLEPVLSGSNTSGMDTRYFMLGATVPVGPGAILASYSQVKDQNVANSKAKMYALGYTYALSKRTNLYTTINHISNDQNTYFGVQTATDNFGGTPGQSANGFALGIRHQF